MFGTGGRIIERLSYDGDFFTGSLLEEVLVLSKLNRIVPDDA